MPLSIDMNYAVKWQQKSKRLTNALNFAKENIVKETDEYLFVVTSLLARKVI